MKINRGLYPYFIFSIFFGLIIPHLIIAQPNAAFRNPNLSNDKRVKDLLLKLTPEEKISLLIASSPGIQRLDIDKYYHGNEALHGVVRPGNFTVFPQAIALACTWDPALMYQVSTAISDEARARWNELEQGKKQLMKFNDLLTFWSPVVNMARDPRWGRTQESYGEDPFLSGTLGVQFVKGLQGNHPRYLKTVATPKHFAVYSQETNRFGNNAIVPMRSLREYYLPAFEMCIKEGKAASIMTSYNAVNGIPSSSNDFLIKQVLRKDWGFDGYVVSDCGGPNHLVDAHHYVNTKEEAAVACLKAGLDLECGDDIYMQPLVDALNHGKVSIQEIDAAAYHVLLARMKLGLFDDASKNPFNKISASVIGSEAHQALALKAAKESIVLLKNDKGVLPLNRNKIKTIAVLGINAANTEFGAYSGTPLNQPVSIVQGIQQKAGNKIKVITSRWNPVNGLESYELLSKEFFPEGLSATYFNSMDLSGEGKMRKEQALDLDVLNHPPDGFIPQGSFSAIWTGKLKPPASGVYSIGLLAHDGCKMYINGKLVIDSWRRKFLQTTYADIELTADSVYDIKVEYFSYRREAAIKLYWKYPGVNKGIKDLFQDVTSVAKSADVVVAVLGINKNFDQEGSDRSNVQISADQEIFIQELMKANPNTIVVLEAGNMLGIQWVKEHAPAIVSAFYPGEQTGNAIADILFGDYNPAGRLPITYYKDVQDLPAMNDYDVTHGRTYQYFKGTPLFEFGYGLSYTHFVYSHLELKDQGSNIRAAFSLKNTGMYDGDEVAQVYVKLPHSDLPMPIKELKGFKRLTIAKGSLVQVMIDIDKSKLRYWDEKENHFVYPNGVYTFMIGSSSSDVRLIKTISLEQKQ